MVVMLPVCVQGIDLNPGLTCCVCVMKCTLQTEVQTRNLALPAWHKQLLLMLFISGVQAIAMTLLLMLFISGVQAIAMTQAI